MGAYIEWVIWDNDGWVEQESCSPYFAEERTCVDDNTCNYAGAMVSGIYNNWNPTEDELKELVYINPTATAIMASYMLTMLAASMRMTSAATTLTLTADTTSTMLSL